MPSTVIEHVEYDGSARQLRIMLTTGRIYVHDAAPPNVVENLLSAASRGAYFNTRIRGAYAYREVEA